MINYSIVKRSVNANLIETNQVSLATTRQEGWQDSTASQPRTISLTS